MTLQMYVACDTPLGVQLATLEAKGNGVIVTERCVERFAELHGWTPDECELLTIVDAATGRLMWPAEPKAA